VSATAPRPPAYGGRLDAVRRAAARLRPDDPRVVAAGLLGLVLLSLLLRSQALPAKYWIDEGLSVSIASHDFWDIPAVLRQDGSPPLYYLLLSLWIDVVGPGEIRTHVLSLACALACIPVAFWVGRSLFGVRQAWGCAAVAAFVPYLTYYAQETRMYALVVLLSLLVVGTFAHVFALGHRRWYLPGLVVASTLALYTHNWSLFLLGACALTWAVLVARAPAAERRGLVRDAALAAVPVAVLYAPWMPTMLFQAAHTGAPWAEQPGLEAIVNGLGSVLGGPSSAYFAGFMGIAGLAAALAARRGGRDGRALWLVIGVFVLAVALAWLSSQVSPAWANRYFAVFVGPLIILLGVALTSYGRLGIAALCLLAFLGSDTLEGAIRGKSNAFRVARTLTEQGYVTPGDLVVNTHPEHGPLMHFYLPDGLRWANALGPVPDPLIFDWTDAQERLERTGPVQVARQLLPTLRPGQHLLLIQPIVRTGRWGAPWTALVRRRAAQWERALDHLPQLDRVGPVPRFGTRRLPRGVRAVVYVRTRVPAQPARAVTPQF
jgi:uncharacterized membrane protein